MTAGKPRKKSGGFQEPRSRITFFLPVTDHHEVQAVRAIIGHLKKSQAGGFTHSLLTDAVFTGEWFDDDANRWVTDRIALFIVDYDVDLDDRELEKRTGKLKSAIRKAYRDYGRRQKDCWLIAQRAMRHKEG